jgi:hypothetical protein
MLARTEVETLRAVLAAIANEGTVAALPAEERHVALQETARRALRPVQRLRIA